MLVFFRSIRYLRNRNFWTQAMSISDPIDVFIIGGGINGCGIARDAVGRGFSVCLAEMNDLASATSSGSTKLIHGGLRYLEHHEFRLVREALREREVLWSMAPHIIRPLRFVLPHHKGLRPVWLLRLGLFLYDHLGGRRLLPGTRAVDLRRDPVGRPLKSDFARGFEYYDCWVDDARLVVLNARDAADRGAEILTRAKVVSALREGGYWTIITETSEGERRAHRARLLVNAAGPWVDTVLNEGLGQHKPASVRLVRGSHIVVPRLFEHDRCYIFQNADGRIIFAIPYERDFTLIGTTDRDHAADPGAVSISQEETDYLCTAASEYFSQPTRPEDVIWSYSAVRPLYNDGAGKAQEATRDYVLKLDYGDAVEDATLINIFGGKITTYRKLAEAAVGHIQDKLGRRGTSWTAGAVLPGGDFGPEAFESTVADLQAGFPFLEDGHVIRLVRLYGTRAWSLLGDARTLDDLGHRFGADLYEAELRYLMAREWAVDVEDILWRRTKLGLRFSAQEVEGLKTWLRDAIDRRMAPAA
jgi:glycerol-3-phosphate dehydrogenase